jgi:hypothetical protein
VAGYDRINGEWLILRQQWYATRRDWQDAVAVKFEKECWEGWETQIPLLLTSLGEIEDTLDRALRTLS